MARDDVTGGDGGGGGGATEQTATGAAVCGIGAALRSNSAAVGATVVAMLEESNNKAVREFTINLGLDGLGVRAWGIVKKSSISGNDHKTLIQKCNKDVSKLLIGPRAFKAGLQPIVGPNVTASSNGGNGMMNGIALAATGSQFDFLSPEREQGRREGAFAGVAAGSGDLYGKCIFRS
jgi:hypothetical protein